MRILHQILDIQGPSGIYGVDDKQISQQLNFDIQEIQDHLEILEGFGYVELAKSMGPTYTAWLTASGRILLREIKKGNAPLSSKSIAAVRKLLYSQTRGDIKQILLEAGASSDRLLPIQVINDMKSPKYLSKDTIISLMFDTIYEDYEKEEADKRLYELVFIIARKGIDVSHIIDNFPKNGYFEKPSFGTNTTADISDYENEYISDNQRVIREELDSIDRHYEYDVFICHASEDKDDVAKPLAMNLKSFGLKVWLDKFIIKIGDSLLNKIDEGLVRSRYGIVILSPSFFRKDWPQKELDGLTQKEIGGQKVILPVWHKVSREDVVKHSPTLAGRLAGKTENGINDLAKELYSAMSYNILTEENGQ